MNNCKTCDKEFIGKRSDAQYCSIRCGNLFRNREYRRNHSNTARYTAMKNEQQADRRATSKGKYAQHRQRAKTCKIPFTISFEDWWSLWEPHFEDYGTIMVMCRTGDKGGYELGNVRIDTRGNNNREAHDIRRNK